jgi:CRISPR/Cas system CSM-associated protein Csm3 (group 7 of RAMP superfamily)
VENKKLDLRVEWNLTLQNRSPIHIGARKEEKGSAEIKPLLNSDENQFVIPGSTIRGVFRNYLYHVVEVLELNPLEDLINRLFGTSEGKGRVGIGDIYLPYSSNLFVKNMTPIGRITQKANDPLKLSTIKTGSKFTVNVVLENPSCHEIGMVSLLLRALQEENLSIGSGETRGLGSVQLIGVETSICQYGQKDSVFTKDGILIPLEADDWNQTSDYISQTYTLKNKAKSLIWMQYALTSLQEKCQEGIPI